MNFLIKLGTYFLCRNLSISSAYTSITDSLCSNSVLYALRISLDSLYLSNISFSLLS